MEGQKFCKLRAMYLLLMYRASDKSSEACCRSLYGTYIEYTVIITYYYNSYFTLSSGMTQVLVL